MLISILGDQISYPRKKILHDWSSPFRVEMVYVLFFPSKSFPQHRISVI